MRYNKLKIGDNVKINIQVTQDELEGMEVDVDGLVKMFYKSELDDNLCGYDITVDIT